MTSAKKKINLALISGGISSEREVSLNGGHKVFEALDRDKYSIARYDPKTDIEKLAKDAPNVDVALVILHGPFGEDGTVQGLLELLGIPYQCSGVLSSAISMNKLVSKAIYEKAGLMVPAYVGINKKNIKTALKQAEDIGYPLVVKPAEAGSSCGISIVKSKQDLEPAINKAFDEKNTHVLAEAYIKGTEMTAGVIGTDNNLEVLPIIEIIPDKSSDFFDYEAKYNSNKTQEICPARISQDLADKVRDCVLKAHESLFCKGYSRTDMIFDGKELYVLETNTIPGMSENSLLPKAAIAAGYSFSGFLDKLIESALTNSH